MRKWQNLDACTGQDLGKQERLSTQFRPLVEGDE